MITMTIDFVPHQRRELRLLSLLGCLGSSWTVRLPILLLFTAWCVARDGALNH